MNKLTLYILFITMILVGSLNTIVLKLQNKTSSLGMQFDHPVFQSAIMFLGEFACLGIFHLFRPYFQKPGDATDFNKFLFAIPAVFDCIGTTIKNVGLVVVSASVYQMIKNSGTLFVAFLSIVFLKKKLFRHHVLGITLIVIGVILTGIAEIRADRGNKSSAIWGISCMLIGQFFYSMLYVAEEKLIKKIPIHPLYAIGLEGISGAAIMLGITLPVVSFISSSSTPYGKLEDVPLALAQIGNSWVLIIAILIYMVDIPIFNVVGLAITKYSSALSRITIDTIRTFVVWMVALLIGWEKFLWLQLVGFLFITCGSLLYNEIIVIPFLGLNKYVGEKKK